MPLQPAAGTAVSASRHGPPPQRIPRQHAKRSERIEELDVRRLTIHPAALRLPMRSEDSDRSRALRESLREQGLLQPLDVDAAGRVLDGRERFRGARALGWKKISCRRVPPSRVAALLGQARLSSPQYSQGQRALFIVAQHWPIFADRKERRLINLKQSQTPTANALGSAERATVAKLVQRLKINSESLRQAARLWEEKENRGKSLIQGVVDGALSLGNAYDDLTHNGEKVEKAGRRLRRWIRQAEVCLAEFSEMTQAEEQRKVRANLSQVRDQIARTLAALPQITRGVAVNGFAHRIPAGERQLSA
ncbi:MAG: ParB N-terminal domain-containing protein [Verrucomicrobia bacterium]|nr:ParB N-terminal domain-containing protein [Verrucomicrobiota bacterium]